MEEVAKEYNLGEGGMGRKGEQDAGDRGTTSTRKLLQPGEEQTCFKKQSPGHRGLGGAGQGTVQQTLG